MMENGIHLEIDFSSNCECLLTFQFNFLFEMNKFKSHLHRLWVCLSLDPSSSLE